MANTVDGGWMAPDGGWGWALVAGFFVSQLIGVGFMKNYSLVHR